MEHNTSKYRLNDIYLKIAVSFSLLLFMVSLTQSAFYTKNPEAPEFSSSFIFAFGWLAFLAGEFLESVLWLANPLYIFAVIVCGFGRKTYAISAAIAALLFGLCFLTIEHVSTSGLAMGPYYTIQSMGNGYWLWLTAITVLAVGTTLSYFKDKNFFSK